jgi:DNA-binding GntR family transcriptional regulator
MTEPSEFAQIGPRQISDHVYEALREKILDCDLTPGQRLAVDEIAQQLGVSRTPVKEALSRLVAEGLIKIQPRRGTFVSDVNAVDIREVFDVREALELKACDLLSDKIDERFIATLRSLNRGLTLPHTDVAEGHRLDFELHRSLVKQSANSRLFEMYSQLNAHVQIARIFYRSSSLKQSLLIVRTEHEAFIEALAEHNIVAAKAALHAHIQSSLRRLINDIQARATSNHG